MTKAKSRHGKLKGAVLLMVLAVMTVLIIMLAGAMAIASTATNRANSNYQESQAYYTARSGVDVLTQTIMGDSKYKSNGSGSLTAIPTGSSDKSQALEIEEAIAGVLYYDVTTGAPYYNTSGALMAWDSINDPTATQLKAKYGNTKANKIINNSYMEFDVSDISWTDGTSGMMADPGDGSVKVRIQLLKLVYDDGTVNGIDRNTCPATGTGSLAGGSSSTYYIKDMWVLMECTATYNGVSSTVSKVITPVEKEKATNVGFTSVGSAGLNNNVDVLGGAVTGGSFNWGNDGTVMGSIFINGDVNVNAQKGLDFTNGESFIVNGNYTNSNNVTIRANTSVSSTAAKPYMFVNGTLDAADNLKIQGGASNTDFDVITKVYKTNNNINTLKGDLYVDGYMDCNANGLQNLNASRSIVDGNIFISDNSEVDYLYNQSNGVWTFGPDSVHKTYMGGIVKYTSDNAAKKITFDVNGTPFWNNTLKNGSLDAICTGKIYYYYDEQVVGGVTKYYGCIEMHALKELLISKAGLPAATVEAKFVETNNKNLKYLIQMDRTDFVDGLTITASDVSCTSGSAPAFKLKISLPKDATTRTTGDDRISLPTLFSKYNQYFCFDDSTCDFQDQSGTVIANFTYNDNTATPVAPVTQSWKAVLKSAYTALNPANTNIEYDKEFTKVWDVLGALNNPTTGARNIQFRTPAQQAQVDGVSTFGDKDDLSSVTTAVKKISDLTPYTGNNDYLEVDTSSGNVILQLDPTGASESCYGGGNNHTAKKGIIVKGSGYLYILLPKNSLGSVYAFKDYLIATEDYITTKSPAPSSARNSSSIAVGKSAGSTVPLVAAPKIMWYADDGVELAYYNGGSTTLMGYLYGPGAKFKTYAGLNGDKTIFYLGNNVKNYQGNNHTVRPSFMGSAFVGDIDGQNNFGLVYIPPEEVKQPHEAKFSWQTGVVGYSYNGIKTAPAT